MRRRRFFSRVGVRLARTAGPNKGSVSLLHTQLYSSTMSASSSTDTAPATGSLAASYLQPSATAVGAVNYQAPDLRKHPPRSPRTRLGGYVQLPRTIDKARALALGQIGEYHFNCPFDQRL